MSTSAKLIASLVRSSENIKCPLLTTLHVHVTVKLQKSNIFKVCIHNRLSSTCSNASSKTLSDCFIDDRLIIWLKCSHSLSKRDFSWATSWILLWYTRTCSFPRSGSQLGWVQGCWLARELERWSLVFHGLTVAQEHCPVSKCHSRGRDCTN